MPPPHRQAAQANPPLMPPDLTSQPGQPPFLKQLLNAHLELSTVLGVLSLKATSSSFGTETYECSRTQRCVTQQRLHRQAHSEAMQGPTQSRPSLSNLAVPMPISDQ